MVDFGYDLWKNVCANIKKYAENYGKFYIQLYPFTFASFYNHLSIATFYNNFIISGAIFEKCNFDFPENLAIKKDGTIRTRYLLTPIIYIYYVAFGEYISKKFHKKSMQNYSCFYAGDFDNDDYHYKNSYNKYVNQLKQCSLEYDYYLKLDISSFFDNIDLRILKINLIKNNVLTETEAIILEKLLSICGNGHMPQIECGITSSYLSTICYLDSSDQELIAYLDAYDVFSKYEVVRYVDDLFIFFSSKGRTNYTKIENDISNYLNNIYHKIGLCLNKEKTKISKTTKIYDDIASFSTVDEAQIDGSIDDIVTKNIITNFLNRLIDCVNRKGISYSSYNAIINDVFNSRKTRYHASQIYFTLVFKSSKWLANTNTKKALKQALDNDYNILVHDPKILTTLIMKTEDAELIKKLLEKLFKIYRSGNWNLICTYIGLIYLFNSGFRHIDLLKIIREQDEVLYEYIMKYCKSDWDYRCISLNTRKFVTKSYLRQSNLFYLLFMYIFELKNANYLHAYAYFKNYFDVITAHFSHMKSPTTKFSIESYYKEKDLIRFYVTELPDLELKIRLTLNDTAQYRNGNPVCHGSAKMLKYINQTDRLLGNIDALQTIINAYIGRFL